MKAHTLFAKAAAGAGSIALAFAMTACSHHNSMAQNAGQNTGEIRTEQAATNSQPAGETLGTAPAPANTQAQPANPGTPAVISGPAAVDNTGRVYTSSSVGSAGNASSVGTNTNVNITPTQTANGSVAVTNENQAPLVTTQTTTGQPSQTTVETTTTVETAQQPAPAPVVVETPAPAPAPVIEAPAPMTSSTTTTETTTTTTHKRLRKD